MPSKNTKVIFEGTDKIIIECPNCKSHVSVHRCTHYKCESIGGECWRCGWRFQVKDYEYDLIQPSSPIFGLIYKYHPEKEAIKKWRKKEYEKEQNKARLEEKYYKDSFLKPWEKKTIKKIVLEEKGF